MKHLIRAIVVTLGTAFLVISEAFACSCFPMSSQESAFEKADIVVLGSVKNVQPAQKGGSYKFNLTVKKIFKGKKEDSFNIYSNIHGFSCGIGLVSENQPMLLYLTKNNHDKEAYRTDSCVPNLFDDAAEEMATQLD